MMAFIKRKLIIVYWITRVNMRMAFLAIISLVVAISLFASISYYNGYIADELYMELFDDPEFHQIELDKSSSGSSLTYSYILSSISKIEQIIELQRLEDLLCIAPLSPASYLEDNITYGSLTEKRILSGHYGLDESILDDCVANSRLPSNNSEIMVIAPDNTSLQVNDEVTLGIGYLYNGTVSNYIFNLTIAGILTNTSISGESPLRNNIDTSNFHFFMQLEFYIDFIYDIDVALTSNSLTITQDYRIDIDTNRINHDNAEEYVRSIYAFLCDFDSYFNERSKPYHGTLKNQIWIVNDIIFFVSLLSIPVIILVITLAFYSSSIFNAKREKTLIFLKTRGVGRKFIAVIMLAETLAIALIASTVSVFLGIPLAMIAGMSSELLAYTENIPDVSLMIDVDIICSIFFTGIVLTLLVNIPSIIKLSRAKIFTLKKVARKKRLKKLKSVTSNLDIILIVLGVVSILFSYEFVFSLFAIPGIGEFMQIFFPFIILLMMASPFLLLTGTVMFYNRFTVFIIHNIGKFFWKRDFWIFASAARTLKANVKITSRTALIICISLSFLMVLSIAPITGFQRDLEMKYYLNGSDISVRIQSGNETVINDFSNALESVPGLNTTKTIIAEFYLINDDRRLYMLGIEPNFVNVAYWQSNYNEKTLDDLCSLIFDSEDNNSVIVDSTTARKDHIRVGMNYEVTMESWDWATIVPVVHSFVPVALTNTFPTLITGYQSFVDSINIIGSYSYVHNLTQQVYDRTSWSILGKVQAGYDPIEVSNDVTDSLLKYEYLYYVHSVPATFKQYSESKYSKLPWTVINNDFLFSLVVILIAIILFSYTRLNQNIRELGLNRALGMNKRQIFLLVFAEPLILLVISAIPGGILGVITVLGMFLTFGSILLAGPPLVLIYDVPVIIATYIILLIFIALVGTIISVKATKINISDYLKME